MELKLPTPPPAFDMDEYHQMSHVQKIRPLSQRWVDGGADMPGYIHLFYVVKMALFVWIGLLVIAATPGFGGIGEIATWWAEPVVFQKVIAFTALVELLGLGQSTGPLTFKFLPPFPAIAHWGWPGSLRQPPWPQYVPLTAGDRRGIVDVLLYWVTVGILVGMLAGGGAGVGGLAPTWLVIAFLAVVVLLGLRDKVVFIGIRPDVYVWAMGLFLFPWDQTLAGLKIAVVAIWLGAGLSKLTRHFTPVVSVMNSNAPLRPKWFKRMLYADFPNDLRPSKFSAFFAHMGTVIEVGAPLVLLFTPPQYTIVIGVAVIALLALHLFILSNVPVAVPNEWNIYMMAAAIWLFWTHRDSALQGLADPVLVVYLLAFFAFPMLYGSFRPDRISFILAMRYYAGNWAASVWAFKGDAVDRIKGTVPKASGLMHEQVETLYKNREFAHLSNHKFRAWRSMHIQGRALNGLLQAGCENIDDYFCIDGELIGSSFNGWNMGDGHMHNMQLLESVQKRCGFAPGELIVVMIESQPIHRKDVAYRIVDAALGTIALGRISVDDLVDRQPWDEKPLALHEDPTVKVGNEAATSLWKGSTVR